MAISGAKMGMSIISQLRQGGFDYHWRPAADATKRSPELGTLLQVFAAVTVYCMARAISIIEQEIRALSSSEKEELLRVLLEELDGPSDPGVDAAWLEESQRRSREIDAGTVQCVPADEVFAKVDALLKR